MTYALRKLYAVCRLFRRQANTFEIRYSELLAAIAYEKATFKAAKKDPNQPFWWSMKNVGLISITIFFLMISPIVLVQLGGVLDFWTAPGFWEVSPGEGMIDGDLFVRIFIIALPTILIAMMVIGYFFAKQCLLGYLLALALLNAGHRPMATS